MVNTPYARAPPSEQTTVKHIARSKPEFIAKCGDSLRELEETAYWFELLMEANCVAAEKLSALRQECDELIAYLCNILKPSKDKPS